ncbi:protein LAS1 isoform X2 [Hevea brasiliensis]|uniref:protein LAS1 isoform X2 n=1 Tax=Hevea brasiliensis TaxID=3981 RepID=UPI0025DF66DC|nr:protein LAS1 isoform X2 [Hevea brasiliensis]
MEALLGFEEQTLVVDADDQVKSSSSRSYKLVPWLNWDEWEWVRDSLFSDSPDKIVSAIKRISTWRSRGCLPVVIDVTASIIEIQQKDPFFRNDLPSDAIHSEQMLAMLYCMAILRLVNCVVEKTRKKTEISIAEAAGAIGIPRTLIDIRHEGSHRDLPALTLVRDSAAKAIHWLKSYYWEPQTEQIPLKRHGTAEIRKEIKSKLRELASCLKVRQSSLPGSSLIRGKRSKKHTTKTLKNLVHLYSSSSLEVLSVLLEFLLKALDSSNLVQFPKDYQIGQDMHKLLDDWKLLITKLSNKVPELLLMLLKAILNMIEAQEAIKYETGTYLASMEYRTGTDKIEQLSFLFAWLVGQLKLLKPFCHKSAKNKTEVFATETDMSNPILMEVLRKCLMISSCGNKQLMDSALHLAELMGNSHLMEKLTKLSCVCFSDLVVTEEIFSPKSSNNLLVQQDESIHQAANKLESVKLHLAKHKIEKTTDGDLGRAGRWSVVKSWNPCPIGMLPRDLGSSGCLPVLDHNDVSKKSVDSSERTQISVAKHSGAEEPSSSIQCDNPSAERRSKREASYDICLLDRSSFKKMRETVYTCDSDEDTLLPDDITSCLVINGVWKKVGEELRAIMSGVGTLV